MATVATYCREALGELLSEGVASPIEADDYVTFMSFLNDYMASLEAINIHLGYTPVSNISDEVTIPAGAKRGVVANLAIELAATYGIEPPASLIQRATAGLKIMRRLGQPVMRQRYPRTLPIGSGNEPGYPVISHFYDGSQHSNPLGGNGCCECPKEQIVFDPNTIPLE